MFRTEGDASSLDALAGVVSPSNETAEFTIHYIDTSVIRSDVTIDAIGMRR